MNISNKYKFTLVVRNINNEQNAIKSLLKQSISSKKFVEIIVYGDEISGLNKYKNITFIDSSFKSELEIIKECVKNSNGEFISFIDSNDESYKKTTHIFSI